MKATISFRSADNGDIEFLLNLRKLSMGQHLRDAGLKLTDEYHMARIQEHFKDSSIIMCNGQDIGLLKLGVLPQSLHIRQFQLMPEFQGKGIGARVLELVKRRAFKLRLPVTLNVLHKNPAKHLYERHGFVVESENKLEYAMCCPLPQNG